MGTGAVGQWDGDLFARYQAAKGEERRRLLGELARVHRPLVLRLVRQTLRDPRCGGAWRIEWRDAVSAGNVAFVRAMAEYDPGRASLAKFLGWKMLDEIQRAAQETAIVMRGRRRCPPEVDHLESDDVVPAEILEPGGLREALLAFLEEHLRFEHSARVAAVAVRQRFESAVVSHIAARVPATEAGRYAAIVLAREEAGPTGSLPRALLERGARRVMVRTSWAPAVRGFAGVRLRNDA